MEERIGIDAVGFRLVGQEDILAGRPVASGVGVRLSKNSWPRPIKR
jgi:hypothetical protein